MKLDKRVIGIGVVVMVLALLVVVGTVLGQGPEGNWAGAVDGGAIILAQPPNTINYQGYLTSASGDPLDGLYDLVFRLYDAATQGNQVWGPELHLDVPVQDGLFQVTLGRTVILYPAYFDEALFLAVEVDGTPVLPRQPLRSVPYAFSLVPGAYVKGGTGTANYALWVENTDTGEWDSGLYAQGERYGIYAAGGGDADIGVYSPDWVHAWGYRSTSDSYVWTPGLSAVISPTAGCVLFPHQYGTMSLECSAPRNLDIHVPIAVPGVLYGQEVRVEAVAVQYKLGNPGSYISRTRLFRITGAGIWNVLIDDPDDRTNTTTSAYTLEATGNYTLGLNSGPLSLNLSVVHDGNPDHDVSIGGIRVRLAHTDEE